MILYLAKLCTDVGLHRKKGHSFLHAASLVAPVRTDRKNGGKKRKQTERERDPEKKNCFF